MSLDDLLLKSEKFVQWMDRQIDGLEVQINSPLRERLAGGCLSTALEHQKAVLLLIAQKLYGSAFALIRILIETYIRGVWLHRCATENDLSEIEKGRDIGKAGDLISVVEKLEGFEEGVFSEMKRTSWGAMNDYTHTGIRQIVRQNTENTIESNYDEKEVLEALKFASGVGWLVAIAICGLARNEMIANAILEKAKELARDW